jgi:hypothetical protein
MSAEERIDANLDRILRASGSALKYCTMHKTLEDMRREMRAIMVAEFIAGTDADRKARGC